MVTYISFKTLPEVFQGFLAFLHLKRQMRPRLSIAPAFKLGRAVGNRFGGAEFGTALRAPTARATRHEVPFSIILIRTLTKSNCLIKGDLK